MKPYYPRPWQIPGLLSGEITRVIVPIPRNTSASKWANGWDDATTEIGVEQNEDFTKDTDIWAISGRTEASGMWMHGRVKAPYQPGDVLAGKETWCCAYHHAQPPVLYKATDRKVELGDGFDSWASPVTIPVWAVRLHLRVLTVEAVRVQDVRMEECDVLKQVLPKDHHKHEGPSPGYWFSSFGSWGSDDYDAFCDNEAASWAHAWEVYIKDVCPDAWDGWAWSVQVERVDTGIPASLEKA